MEIKDFEDLISLGRVQRTVKLGSRDVLMHTLSTDEYAKMSQGLDDNEPSQAKRFESLQRGILSGAIESIDGKVMSGEDKTLLVGKLQLGTCNMLYDIYTKMVEEQNKILTDSKKNSSQELTGNLT